jgi:hypothetical protein
MGGDLAERMTPAKEAPRKLSHLKVSKSIRPTGTPNPPPPRVVSAYTPRRMPVMRRVPITAHIRARKKEGRRQATRSSRSTMGR